MCHKNFTIPIFIPELACPFQCLYCNQRKISGQISVPNDDEIVKVIEDHLKTIPQNGHIELGFFGGNFTGIPIHDQKHYFELVQPFLTSGQIKSIRCSTRPDYINEEVLELLKSYGVKTIELGAQSLDDEVLKKSGRGHMVNDTLKASEMIINADFKLGLQMMIGLPGDTKEKSLSTAKKIIELGAENTRIYPTLVIKGTALEDLYKAGKYKPLSIDEAVEWTAEIMPLFEEAGVKILRVGLHPSEGLCEGADLIAGPYHPSFRELVYTEIWRNIMSNINTDVDSLKIYVNPAEFNYAIGHKGSNKACLKKQYQKVKFIKDSAIPNREFRIEKF